MLAEKPGFPGLVCFSAMLVVIPEAQFCSHCQRGCGFTWPEQPPAVLLVCGTLAVVAVALRLVVAGFAVHSKAVFGTLRRCSGAVISQVTLAC